jgi:hypothetical protein
LLGDILNGHNEIARWYEPYFIIDHFFRGAPDDSLDTEDATPEVKHFIKEAFKYYGLKLNSKWVIDKSPRNSLKIPFLLEVFPSAKFIHIIRDGRDAVLSIHREWIRRDSLIGVQKRPFETFLVIWNWIRRQPLWKHKLSAMKFESGGILGRIKGEPFLHKIRWNNRVGWGPRFPGWKSEFDNSSTLKFNALQWVHCVESILGEIKSIDYENYFPLRYEDLLKDPQMTLTGLFNFLQVPCYNEFFNNMPVLQRSNFGKWQTAFSDDELLEIGPIINPTLQKTGYAGDSTWYINK